MIGQPRANLTFFELVLSRSPNHLGQPVFPRCSYSKYLAYDTLPKSILGSRVPKSMSNVMNIDLLAYKTQTFVPHLATWPQNSPCDIIYANESMTSQKLFSLFGEVKTKYFRLKS